MTETKYGIYSTKPTDYIILAFTTGWIYLGGDLEDVFDGQKWKNHLEYDLGKLSGKELMEW